MSNFPSNPPIIKRAAAHAQGLTRFFTGKPCSRGHTVQRYVASGACILCARATQRDYSSVTRGALHRITFPVTVHVDDAEAIRTTVAMLNGARDAKAAALDAATDMNAVRESLKHKHSGKKLFADAPESKPSGKFSD